MKIETYPLRAMQRDVVPREEEYLNITRLVGPKENLQSTLSSVCSPDFQKIVDWRKERKW
jgi:hypothetical protein